MSKFSIEPVVVPVDLSVEFAIRLSDFIRESKTEDRQMRAFSHHLERAMSDLEDDNRPFPERVIADEGDNRPDGGDET